MIPWDRKVGRDAFRRLKVFQGIPDEFNGKTLEKIASSDASKLRTKFVTLGEVSMHLGAKKRE